MTDHSDHRTRSEPTPGLMASSAMPSPTSTLQHEQGVAKAVPAPSPGSPRSSVHSDPIQAETHGKQAEKVGPGHEMQAPLEIPKWKFWAIFCGLAFSIFLFALDQLIVATAIPKITAEFNSLTELSWLANGFFLTLFGFNLLYSQWLSIFPSKHVILFAIFIFEVGSLVCGVAPDMKVLILGRAIAGVGGAGIFSCGMVIIAELTPLHNRAQYLGLFGVCFALASVLGPLVGGAFSDHVSWRWCFYINLPFGGVALAAIILFQPTKHPLGQAKTYKGYSKDMVWKVVKCDWLGAAIAMGWAISGILFMQWGGVTKSWSDGSVIACIVVFAILPFVFVGYEWWLGEKAMFKLALFKRRSIAGACIVLLCLFGVFMIEVYYLSEGFQAAYHSSATGAGVKLLPLILVQVAVLMASSRIIPHLGRFKWVIVAGPAFLVLACGLLYSVKYGTSIRHIYGYEVLLAIGIGCAMQNSMLAVQFELKKEPWLVSAGTGLSVFVGFAGRIVFLSMGGSVFQNMLKRNINKYAPELPAALKLAVISSATAVYDVVPEDMREPVLIAYTETLRVVYVLGLPLAFVGLLGGLLIKNSKMQTKEQEEAAIKASREKSALEAAGEPVPEKLLAQAEGARDVEEAVQGVIPSGNVPDQAVQGGKDAQVLLAQQEGKSAV